MSGRRAKMALEPVVLRWARERARLGPETIAAKMNVHPHRVLEWERSGRISMSQADRLAHHTHTPFGYLFLREPPKEDLPIPDFRSAREWTSDVSLNRPSPDLLETVYLMDRRQSWMREDLIEEGADPLPFVGCCGIKSDPVDAAVVMREWLKLGKGWAANHPTWTDALRYLRESAETCGILVVFNGVVGNNNHRRLDRNEFQGFALVDRYSPLIFVNGADFKAAQMFTLAHEIAHIFIGRTGVSNLDFLQHSYHEIERYCNCAAAEFLVSGKELRACWERSGSIYSSLQSVTKKFKVSAVVAARRALELRLITQDEFRHSYDEIRKQSASRPHRRTGGNFWNIQNLRVGRRFGRAVGRAVKEGRMTYREAYSLTGLRGDTFETFIRLLDQKK